MRSIVSRAKRICDEKHLADEFKNIRKFAAWNNFPARIRNALMSRFCTEQGRSRDEVEADENSVDIWLKLPFIGRQGENMVQSFIKKVKKMLKPGKKVNFKVRYRTTPLLAFTGVKDPTPFLNKSNVVYKISCPGCGSSYIGKTDRTLFERISEHAWTDKSSIVRQHLDECDEFNYILAISNINEDAFHDVIHDNDNDDQLQKKEFRKELTRQNTRILDRDDNWNVLLYKEAFYINRHKSSLNNGLKASRETVLFK